MRSQTSKILSQTSNTCLGRRHLHFRLGRRGRLDVLCVFQRSARSTLVPCGPKKYASHMSENVVFALVRSTS
eukprot:2582414-Amphidinium_carterae.1